MESISPAHVATQLTHDIGAFLPHIRQLQEEVGHIVVGQRYMVDRLILALIADGHVLIEGAPGLAKTTTIKAVADAVDTSFSRIQFTPDLLPADLIGTEIYRPEQGGFTIKKGPIFTNLLLADEINRAPAKVQSALLEAMQERQVSIGDTTYPLSDPFLVLATQNPIEQEGTYALPEAQIDRFLFKLKVGYPDKSEEKEIMRRMSTTRVMRTKAIMHASVILEARQMAQAIYLDAKIEDYIVNIVFATREESKGLITYGASPRATIALAKAAKVQALMMGRAYVTPQDIKTIGHDVLRHRIMLSYEAEAQDLSADKLITQIFNTVDVP